MYDTFLTLISLLSFISDIYVFITNQFAKFKKPSDVPNHFLQSTELQGRVTHIDPSYGVLLLIDHKPLIPFPQLGREKYLPIKLAGINTTNHGKYYNLFN